MTGCECIFYDTAIVARLRPAGDSLLVCACGHLWDEHEYAGGPCTVGWDELTQ